MRHPGNFYLLLGLARSHYTGEEYIVYIPLRVELEWEGTARMALRTPDDFCDNFRFVGSRLPNYLHKGNDEQ